MPEALAALVSYDPEDDGDSVAAAMRIGVDGVRSGEVTQAVRDSQTDAGPVKTGDWISLVRGDGIVAAAATLDDALVALLADLVDEDSGLVTIIEGAGASDAVTDAARQWLATHFGDVEIEIHLGGQPLYPYLVGVE
jgi:dihydroxyacetone kinase-like predicted kinase